LFCVSFGSEADADARYCQPLEECLATAGFRVSVRDLIGRCCSADKQYFDEHTNPSVEFLRELEGRILGQGVFLFLLFLFPFLSTLFPSHHPNPPLTMIAHLQATGNGASNAIFKYSTVLSQFLVEPTPLST
jgi:hypothetical protein